MILAAKYSKPEIIDYLYKNNVDLNVKDDNFGWTPLHFGILIFHE